MNLFIIDDDPLQHLIMERMLSLYLSDTVDRVTYSNDAVEMLKFIEANSNNPDQLPDIIFLDLNMPIMSGWDFLEYYEMLKPKITKLITVYVVSSSVDPREISRAKSYLSVKDYILKPVTRPMLEKIFEIASSNKTFPGFN